MRIEVEKVKQSWRIFRRTVDDKKIPENKIYASKDEALSQAREDRDWCLKMLGEEAVAELITVHEDGVKTWVS
tara:strand:- start:4023 stop:4241 length:219 start_codon:yes stop_codon:yes gene_type:complete